MKPDSAPIEKFAVAVAVGSMVLLGAFFIADSLFDGLMDEFERYSSTKAWSIVAALPAITFSYVVGAFVIVVADLLFERFNPRGYAAEWHLLSILAKTQNQLLIRQFEDIIRAKRILEGTTIPLFVLGVGIAFEIKRLPQLAEFLWPSAALVLALAVISPFVSWRLEKTLKRLQDLVEDPELQAS